MNNTKSKTQGENVDLRINSDLSNQFQNEGEECY